MSTLEEIEQAIAQLPESQVERLAHWLEIYRTRRRPPPSPEQVQEWLKRARGAGNTGLTTDQIMEMTRGEE